MMLAQTVELDVPDITCFSCGFLEDGLANDRANVFLISRVSHVIAVATANRRAE